MNSGFRGKLALERRMKPNSHIPRNKVERLAVVMNQLTQNKIYFALLNLGYQNYLSIGKLPEIVTCQRTCKVVVHHSGVSAFNLELYFVAQNVLI